MTVFVQFMLHGHTSAHIHAGTWCRVSADGEAHDGELCVILGFEAESSLWRIGLAPSRGTSLFEPEASLTVLMVPEDKLSLEFCLLPRALDAAVCHPNVATEESQGTCGRGLIVTDHVKRGCALFEEPPFMVVHRVPSSVAQHHGPRWRAYTALCERAQSSGGALDGGLWATALGQFNNLDFDKEEISHVLDGAAKTMDADAFASAEARAAGMQDVCKVLMRFHCNQFAFENGAAGNAALSADALYVFSARANHSCEPTIAFANLFALAAKRGKPLAVDEGKVRAFAKRDLLPGERLTHSYLLMPPEWGYQRRRAALWDNYGFRCGCEKCSREEAAEKDEAAGADKRAEGGAEEGAEKDEAAGAGERAEGGAEDKEGWSGSGGSTPQGGNPCKPATLADGQGKAVAAPSATEPRPMPVPHPLDGLSGPALAALVAVAAMAAVRGVKALRAQV